ncbi:putative quinol monooxygenase [Lacihabitans soyangensis]|uniref:Antibiotic biosynthesis monooxygenase n=1 Tax=Lacihabitans soyangensis TaxID=869394 RepID=A0AAE3KR20_9BACT|nr:antibiotic biosynthesis monooxygenase family protein [Lacihabitans soyangensis]MCP9761648.1 antibiotic biosynthesis monooxygenase [Lacihabitans soyangensis]
MIVRIVKMTFKEDKIIEFLAFLEENKSKIRDFPGCEMVEILQEKDNPAVIMTHSHWQSEAELEAYRNSDLFNFVWSNTKIHFNAKPEAYSMLSLDKL